MTWWKKTMAPLAAVSPASPAVVRLCSVRVVKAVTAAPHSAPSSRIRVVRMLSKGGGLGLDNTGSLGRWRPGLWPVDADLLCGNGQTYPRLTCRYFPFKNLDDGPGVRGGSTT
jgi:hypothetical protein